MRLLGLIVILIGCTQYRHIEMTSGPFIGKRGYLVVRERNLCLVRMESLVHNHIIKFDEYLLECADLREVR